MDSSSDSDDGHLPAVLNRPKVANYLVSERVTVDTRDHEDHTFCGVMFDVSCKETLPAAFLEISGVAVRGDLGPMTVWATPRTFRGKSEDETQWRRIYSRKHPRSPDRLVSLDFPEPLRVGRGESVGLYVHSGLRGDTGLVYDEQRSRYTHDDDLLRIHPGLAHISNRPFGRTGLWGHPWRSQREFVGRLAVGVGWQLWNPETHRLFPPAFRRAVACLFLCASRPSSPLSCLSDVVLMYILNLCRWDWFGGLECAGAPSAAGPGTTRAGAQEGDSDPDVPRRGRMFGFWRWGPPTDEEDTDEEGASGSDDEDAY
uniref:Uncharacterized protein n=1 Tax=Alexandrium catenella TaxID=2925 RepID=A0A7S1RNA2_ALECA|mmetsp:Transcript_65111/g.173606  ORF Transcript_65111/g.173606 Transcript_65111/m.173606 type:complete len:314 (+) Transcript_65111:59-1000(+)